jgi:type IV pilus assembly protein PilW
MKKPKNTANKLKQRGLSLIELMVALVLGLVISAAIIQVFLTSKNVYRMQDAMARIQENGRFAVDYISRDLRMAGYMGCGNLDRIPVNVIADTPANWAFGPSNILIGQNNVTATNALGAKPGTDAIQIRRAAGDSVRLTGNLSVANANIQLVDNRHGFKKNDTLMISDCVAADVFNVVNKPQTNNSDKKVTIAHSSGGNTSNRLSKLYGSDSEVMAFEKITYYVSPSLVNPAADALWMLVEETSTAGTPVELVEGVDDLQFEFGVDTSGDRNLNVYQTANNVTDWSGVISVRFSLLMADPYENTIASSGDFAQSIQYNGAAIASDGTLRDVFESVVAVRNRVP